MVTTHARAPGAPPPTRLADVRRRILDAARRGLAEAAIPVVGSIDEIEEVWRILGDEGFGVTPVSGEDGPYAVVHW
jgi:hypothetical protein